MFLLGVNVSYSWAYTLYGIGMYRYQALECPPSFAYAVSGQPEHKLLIYMYHNNSGRHHVIILRILVHPTYRLFFAWSFSSIWTPHTCDMPSLSAHTHALFSKQHFALVIQRTQHITINHNRRLT